jgi:exopolyphosphatase/guanosine-5'-triphosphate,3'-diphosphate pyrophosphatase
MPRLSAIDIGTNTVLLCVADHDPKGLRPVLDRAIISRLGEGLDGSGELGSEAIERTLDALRSHLDAARLAGASRVAAVATAALREARNAGRFLEEAERRLGLKVEVIPGEEEARLALEAVARGIEEAGESPEGELLVMDIGGGSTEFIHGLGRMPRSVRSLPVGSVRLTERFFPDDPVKPPQLRALAAHVREAFAALPAPHAGCFRMVGVAGTVTTLAAMKLRLREYDAEAIRRARLTGEDLDLLIAMLAARTVTERCALPGLEPGRADVILAGGIIAREAMVRMGVAELHISDRGVRHGAIYRLAEEGERRASP